MLATIVDLLTTPDEFFAERPDPQLRWPALVVAVSGLLYGIAGAVIVLQFRALVPHEGILLVIAVAMVPMTVVGGLLTWGLVSVALYALSDPFADRGDVRTVLAYAGWGWLPRILSALVVVFLAVRLVTQVEAPTDLAATLEFARQVEERPLVALASAAGTARTTVSGSFSQVETTVAVGTALWSGYVWAGALRQARGLTRRQALLAVALPVLFLVLR